jgi:hypothetical protein
MPRKTVMTFCERPLGASEADLGVMARWIAELKGFEYGGALERGRRYDREIYLVPKETLVGHEAARAMGVRSARDLFGGIVPNELLRSKVITHRTVSERARRPEQWPERLFDRIDAVVLPGFTAFTIEDAIEAGERLLEYGSVRIKDPLATGGIGQGIAKTKDELRSQINALDRSKTERFGVVLETNLDEATTFSVGLAEIDELTVSYFGTQRLTTDNRGREVYGGSDLTLVRGGFERLLAIDLEPDLRRAIDQAVLFDEAASQEIGLVASRRNYDVGLGLDGRGRKLSGVFDQSWRIGGASAAEIIALRALEENGSMNVVRASTVELFGEHVRAPAGAAVLYEGSDPKRGRMIKYAVLNDAH